MISCHGMPPITNEADYKIIPLLALQVTLFPGWGICFGFSNDHALWKIFTRKPFNPSLSFPIPTNNVRATFILRPADIKKLKEIVLEKKPDLTHVSSFAVGTSYIWSCILKSDDEIGEEIELPEFFVFSADARGQGRVDPPVPVNYFGNCIAPLLASSEHKKLVEDDGFVHGVEVVAEVIKKKVSKNGELLKGAENWIEEFGKLMGSRKLRAAGSPKFDLGKADFGWGKPRKMEVLPIDEGKYGMSLCNSMDVDGGLEIGLSMPKQRMEVFASVFAYGLPI